MGGTRGGYKSGGGGSSRGRSEQVNGGGRDVSD